MQFVNLEMLVKLISKELNVGKELINEGPILEFQSDSVRLADEIRETMKEERLLRIGITGQVKAGKSSFLNALLFEGKDILPKAPTPMTAALTRISYDDVSSARIVFYKSFEWDMICSMAQKYDEVLDRLYQEYLDEMKNDKNSLPKSLMTKKNFEKINRDRIPEGYRSGREVVKMCKERQLDVSKYLGTDEIIEADTRDEYAWLNHLNDYIGAEGCFTPIVSHTEIKLRNEMLKGIEIVDTPGLNDPIQSRSKTTEIFLGQCDVVFMIASCGQFLNAEDMNFLISSLPNEGVSKAVIIGSKLDSAIQQYPKAVPFRIACVGTIKSCRQQAEQNFKECRKTEFNEKLLDQIKASLPVECISSYAYTAAIHMERGETLEKDEEFVFQNISKKFPDFTFDVETLMDLSNIPTVKNKVFTETKQQKKQIIQERKASIVHIKVRKVISALKDIENQANMNMKDLKTYDYKQLKEKLEQLKESLDSIRFEVKNAFEQASIESARMINEIGLEVQKEMGNHYNISIYSDRNVINHIVIKRFLFFFKKEHHWDEVIKTDIAEVKDAVGNMRKYRLGCMQIVNSSFQHLLKIEELKKKIRETVVKAFQQSERDFNERRILIPLENSLSRLMMPQIELNSWEYENMLYEQLGGIVLNGVIKDENIPLLRQALDKVLAKMSEDTVSKIKEQGRVIESYMQNLSGEFIDHIVSQLEENQQKLEQLLNDKQTSLNKYEAFLKMLSNAINLLKQIEV